MMVKHYGRGLLAMFIGLLVWPLFFSWIENAPEVFPVQLAIIYLSGVIVACASVIVDEIRKCQGPMNRESSGSSQSPPDEPLI
jgi:hypothetical protein